MKKVVSIILVLVMCISLIACTKSKVQSALQGSWSAKWYAYGYPVTVNYSIKGSKYTKYHKFGNNSWTSTGTFEVTDSTIVFTSDDGISELPLDYYYDKTTGTITLWLSNGNQLEKSTTVVNFDF